MWGLFWRLYSAHLFADFPLQTPAILAQKKKLTGIIIHTALVFSTAMVVVIQPALYRPALFAMVAVLTAIHFVIDWVKSLIGEVSAKTGVIIFIADQIVHLGTILLIAVVFGWNYYYGPVSPFVRLAIAIFAIWGAPVVIYILMRVVHKEKDIGIYREPFARFAKLERALLFIGLSFQSVIVLVIGVFAAVIIRALLLLNEENVPVPIMEWLAVILLAAIGRLVEYGAIF